MISLDTFKQQLCCEALCDSTHPERRSTALHCIFQRCNVLRLQCGTMLYCTVMYTRVLCCTVPFTAACCAVLCTSAVVLYCNLLMFLLNISSDMSILPLGQKELFCDALCDNTHPTRDFTALHCILQRCTALHCTVLHFQ